MYVSVANEVEYMAKRVAVITLPIPKTCSALLEELRKARGSKDIVTTSALKQVDDIDAWDLEVSIRNEVEFSGCRYKICEVTIKTPSGKVKKVVRIGN